MNIRKTIISATVALTMVAMIAPAGASALTVADLQAQINALLAQLAALQGGSVSTGTMPAACVGITFTRNLYSGVTGSDVKCLQAILNTSVTTQVSTSGAGAPGMETTTFGPKTLAAVQKYQTANGITPASQVGPLTRAKLNAWLSGGSTGTPGVPPVVTPTGSGLSVMLASNNPAAGTIVDGQALAPLAAFTFVNGDNAPVKVTGLKLKRIGVSADASLTNVYLFNGAERLTDGAAVSSTMLNFNNTTGIFTVPSMGSVTIWVLADVDGTAGETVGIQLVSSTDVTTNASSVKGVYPITGNLMNLATGTLAGVNFNSNTTPAAADVDPQEGYTVWQNSVTITTRAVDMKRISFRKTGSTSSSDLKNFRLYVDGMQVGSAAELMTNSTGDTYVTFDLSSAPKRLEAGTRVVKLVADIIGGSDLTFTMHLWNVADATFVDSQYNANILAQANSATFSKRSSGEQTINSGTLTITKMTTSPSGDIVDGASNTLLAKFELKAAGESVKVDTLYVSANVNTAGVSGLRNGMLLANGVQIGSTTTLYDPADSSFDYTTFNLGSSLIVVPGSPVILEVKADIYDIGTGDSTNSIVAGSTIQVTLEGASSNNNGLGLVSATTLDVPSADVSGNTVTVRQGTLTLSKYTAYTNHTVVAPLNGYKLGHFTLTAATSEAVNLTAINVAIDDVSSYTTNLYVKYGTATTTIKPTVSASNTWSVNYTLPAGQTIDVMVYGDVSSLMTGGDGVVTVDIDGTTVSSAVTADSSSVGGQTITFSSGEFATAFDGAPQNQVVSGACGTGSAAGCTGIPTNGVVLAGRFKLTSSYTEYTVREMRFTTGSSLPISSATLKDAATGATLTTIPYDNTNSYFNFTGLSVVVPASTSKRVDLYWNLAVPSATNSSTNVNAVAALTYVKYADQNGTEAEDSNTRTGNETYVFRSVPTITKENLSAANIINGSTMELYSVKVAAPSQGAVDLKQIKFDLNWSDASSNDTLELESLKLLRNGSDITSSVNIIDEDAAADKTGTSGVTEGNSKVIIVWKTSTEETISAGSSNVYTLTGVPQGFSVASTANDSVSLQFVPDSAHQTSGYNYINVGTSLTGILKLYSSASANASAENANLIWSDESAVAHSASTTAGTNDWSNSYLFNAIGSQSWATNTN